MTKDQINSVKIEPRDCGTSWNITMFVHPKGKSPRYDELVKEAEKILRETKGLTRNKGWYASNADVMAWSGDSMRSPDYISITTPHEYRVTLDMLSADGKKEVNLPCDSDITG